ncbi:MAG: iron-sulfur cluster assembly scaffold protein [Candidatus Nanohaloarchaea archaeon]
MYRDEILDLYKHPRNAGSLEHPDFEAEGENPSCGDHIVVGFNVEDGEIEEMRHETDGCAICTAAASILTEEVQGMSLEELEGLDRDWMLEKLGIEVSPMRVKCAMLGLNVVQDALDD